VMNADDVTEEPVVLKFRLLVEVKLPEAAFVREPETLPVIVIDDALTPAATTGRENVRLRTFVPMS
jgi:hypothetical protein